MLEDDDASVTAIHSPLNFISCIQPNLSYAKVARNKESEAPSTPRKLLKVTRLQGVTVAINLA
jgi:hypothetical protein